MDPLGTTFPREHGDQGLSETDKVNDTLQRSHWIPYIAGKFGEH